ncbi:hypothetical protein LJ737_09480 [Hymenobacter sp. 15J16-1T3B]|nr:hypothetical protein [Hymenobacter sp. 15J16-1T3B]
MRQSYIIRYCNDSLGTCLTTNGDFILRQDRRAFTRKERRVAAKKLGVAARQFLPLFTGTTNVPPYYRLRAAFIRHRPGSWWLTAGFTAVGAGRFARSITQATELSREYAYQVPNRDGFLYLVATEAPGKKNEGKPLVDRAFDMDMEFNAYVFPSVQPRGDSTLLNVSEQVDQAFLASSGGNYLAPLIALLDARRNPALINDASQHPLLQQLLVQYHAMAGNQDSARYFRLCSKKALLRTSVPLPAEPDFPHSSVPPAIESFQTEPAVQDILQRAASAKALLINEHHGSAHHRSLLAALLPQVYALGYRYLALETLSDSGFNERGFPLMSSGFYTREPTFANLVRTAHRIGFKLVGYDDMRAENRELSQAQHLLQALKTDPQARVVVYGGGQHMEVRPGTQAGAPGGAKKWMGQYLAELSQWPLTSVNQTYLEDVSLPAVDSLQPGSATALYKMVNNRRAPLRAVQDVYVRNKMMVSYLPVPYFDQSQTPWVNLPLPAPSSQAAGRQRQLIQVYLARELNRYPDPVPVYTAELTPRQQQLHLRLCPGQYSYKIYDEAAEVITGNWNIE